MQLPETQNAHYVHAFKKGYRLALESKSLTNMPSAFRYDHTLRNYYEQGWSQANEELEAGYKASIERPWRSRFAWFLVIIIGSLVTAVGLINGIKQEQAEQQARILGTAPTNLSAPIEQTISALNNNPNDSTIALRSAPSDELSLMDNSEPALSILSVETASALKSNPADLAQNDETATAEDANLKALESLEIQPKPTLTQPSNSTEELSLLSDTQRDDLILNQQEFQTQTSKQITLSPLVKSNISIESAQLTSNVVNKQATDILSEQVPKQIRNLYFFTQVTGAKNQTLYHRWLFKNQEMALIPLNINSNLYRTWSSKKMARAWQGQWTIEVLNENKDVIYRQSFKYGNL